MTDREDTYGGIFWVPSKDFDRSWQAATPGESCDEITRLRAENVQLRESLTEAQKERAHQQGRATRNAKEYAAEQERTNRLRAENARLRVVIRVNALRWAPHLSHAEIDAIVAAAPGVKP